MKQAILTVLRYVQDRGGSCIVQNPVELGLTLKAFTVAVNYLHQHGLIVQEGLSLAVLYGAPVSLRTNPILQPAVILR